MTRIVRAWFVYVRNGGFARAEVVDEEEEFFRAFDVTPIERKQERE